MNAAQESNSEMLRRRNSSKKSLRLATQCSSARDQQSLLAFATSPLSCDDNRIFFPRFLQQTDSSVSIRCEEQLVAEMPKWTTKQSGPVTSEELASLRKFLEARWHCLRKIGGDRILLSDSFAALCEKERRLEQELRGADNDQILRQSYEEKMIEELKERLRKLERDASRTKHQQRNQLQNLDRLGLRTHSLTQPSYRRIHPKLFRCETVLQTSLAFTYESPSVRFERNKTRQIEISAEIATMSQLNLKQETLKFKASGMALHMEMIYRSRLNTVLRDLLILRKETIRARLKVAQINDKKRLLPELQQEYIGLVKENEFLELIQRGNRLEIQQLRRTAEESHMNCQRIENLTKKIAIDRNLYEELLGENHEQELVSVAISREMQLLAEAHGYPDVWKVQAQVCELRQLATLLKSINDDISQNGQLARMIRQLEHETSVQRGKLEKKEEQVKKKRHQLKVKEYILWSCMPVYPSYEEDIDEKDLHLFKKKTPANKFAIGDVFFSRNKGGRRILRARTTACALVTIFAVVYFGLLLNLIFASFS